MHDVAAELGRPVPPDIVFMPAGLDMFARAAPDASAVLDELHALAEVGVTWATVTLPGETRADLLGAVEAFGRDVVAHLEPVAT